MRAFVSSSFDIFSLFLDSGELLYNDSRFTRTGAFTRVAPSDSLVCVWGISPISVVLLNACSLTIVPPASIAGSTAVMLPC